MITRDISGKFVKGTDSARKGIFKYGIKKLGTIDWHKGKDVLKRRRYKSFHMWLLRNCEYPKNCELCYREGKLEWANITQEYFLDREDFWALCRKCHHDYDWWCKTGFR